MVSVRQSRDVPQADVAEEVVEKGDIYFAYRPRIAEDVAESLSDVQRFYMVMKPEGRSRLRVAMLGRKRLPRARDHERIWGLIGARTDPERAYGVEIEAEHETVRDADIFRQLKMSPREHPIGPLIKGKWQ